MIRWPHQLRAVTDFENAVAAGEKRIVLTSPTGGGKTIIVQDLAESFTRAGKKVVFYSNRKLLIEQVSGVFERSGVAHGIRRAGVVREDHHLLQVSSIQTEHARSPSALYTRLKKKGASDTFAQWRAETSAWDLHAAELVIVDEGHLHTAEQSQRIINKHLQAGAVVLYVTATPLGIEKVADRLIVAGTPSQLRGYDPPALVPARHFGCDEPQLALKAQAKLARGEDLTEEENSSIMMTEGIYGRVFEHYRRINPASKPTILFAPGVKESIWFAEEFMKRGVSAAHIDGESIWLDGKVYQSTRERRERVLSWSKDGRIKVLCNRFVLREGVDAPWLSHGILATIFGSLQSYLQSGGRLLRSHPGVPFVTIQDHGGNWWRFGSLNDDRRWDLSLTSRIMAGVRREEFENPPPGLPPQPFQCPSCKVVLRLKEIAVELKCTCPDCGHQFDFSKRSRAVVMSDGRLIEYKGDAYKPKRTRREDNTERLWEICYWRGKSAKKWNPTFLQLYGLFQREYKYKPPKGLPLMPVRTIDWFKKVKRVPFDMLVPKPPKELHE